MLIRCLRKSENGEFRSELLICRFVDSDRGLPVLAFRILRDSLLRWLSDMMVPPRPPTAMLYVFGSATHASSTSSRSLA